MTKKMISDSIVWSRNHLLKAKLQLSRKSSSSYSSFFPPILYILVWFLVKRKKKGCVGVEMLFAVVHSRRISCRLQSTIPSELRATAWTVAGFTEDALIFRPPHSTVLLEYWSGPFPKRWFIYELNRMVVILQSQRLSNRVDQRDYQHEWH